jgi:hypothetical protein
VRRHWGEQQAARLKSKNNKKLLINRQGYATMARTKQTTQNRPPGLIQLQAAKAFAALNSAANAGIQPREPIAKMDAGQDSSSSDDKQEEAQEDDQKLNYNKQEDSRQ